MPGDLQDMKRVLYRAFPAVFLIALLAFAVSARGRASVARYKKFSIESFDSFDTLVTFTAFAKDESEFERYAKILRGEMSRLHKLFDIYHEYGGIANMKTVNDAAGASPVTVDPSIIGLLETAKEAYGDTGGAMNVALGPVLAIWHNYREAANGGGASLPSEGELRAAAEHISVRDIVTDRDKSTVFLKYSDMRVDVGAIAKGFAAQKTAELLRGAGLDSGIINAGGNVVIIGPPKDGRETWNIGVHAPADDGDMSKLFDVLYLRDGSAVTSGSDQRYFIAGGRRYHHIIDPETLFPAGGFKSVTILHHDSTYADILSTAAFILPMEASRELLARHGAEAVWVTEEGKVVMTEGYKLVSKMGREKKTAGAPAGGGE
jgi:thiamine biosynthesis lipoprotein